MNATLKQWRLTFLWGWAIFYDSKMACMHANISVDDTAAKSVVVDTTADLGWQPEQWGVGSVGSRTRTVLATYVRYSGNGRPTVVSAPLEIC